ncbi:MAG: SUMF1/EgtB/PvdO family nonheme iron enzyme [bacterium]|nr:SUMF1/EgtB/PvdO family nonheme iron enzyme [bacterium]
MMKSVISFVLLFVMALSASAAKRGDVNGDLTVNVSDVTALVNKILSIADYHPDLCDLNGDGTVNVSDVTTLVNIILNGDTESSDIQTFTVNGVTFKMVTVEGGTFTMGGTSEQGAVASDEKPTHSVTLSTYLIGKTEVTQELWQAVMGTNPSTTKGNSFPVVKVSWNDCQTFIKKLNALTGKNFRLPTEAEWEYAARGGNKSKAYKYSGSSTINNVAWYKANAGIIKPVASMQPNELGIYDMSGNVWEFCNDWYGNYSGEAQTNPIGPASGDYRVQRGGSCATSADQCRISYRGAADPTAPFDHVGLRLCLSTEPSFTVNGVSFDMVEVEGGTFTMGATAEQTGVFGDEKPAHQVTLPSYYIGKTEVTQELWQAVMGSNPSNFTGTNLPVEKVSWDDCKTFIAKLNALTGKNFRLPTEAEWEFAARGGNKSRGYKYCGSNTLSDVAWYVDNSDNKTHPVAAKTPNELGIYDMSGNVLEWCNDWYSSSYYTSESQTNPTGPDSGSSRVRRGGSWNYSENTCRVSYRGNTTPSFRYNYLGLRLCLSAEESFTVNGVSFAMVPVAGGTFTMGATPEQGTNIDSNEKPTHQVTLSSYMIAKTEVTQALWRAVTGETPSYFKGDNLPVEQVSWDDCQKFITKLNALTGKNFRLPTEAEWEYAARGGNMSQGYKYSGSNEIGDVAWYDNNSGNKTHSVATKAPNELGIYDMSGNLWEWCSDWYGSYSSTAQTNPTGPDSGSNRIIRGGSWGHDLLDCRVAIRGAIGQTSRSIGFGLRLAF